MALAGAATVRVPQQAGYLSVKGGILSPDGHCRAFDAQAQGTVFGSGVGVVLLKELAAAVADGDNIYAVIRGSAINNDGAGKVSYTASSVAGQARAMAEAMSVAKSSPEDIGYVECHGTGTIVGDPLEIDALTRAFRTGTDKCGFCAIGSVKTNIGHLEQTAGIAALIKTALVLKNARIPPSLHFHRPNPKIDFAATPFFVNTECREWPAHDHPRLAAVNSLGLGGTNAFVVLEQPPSQAGGDDAGTAPLNLFALSAKTPSALRMLIERQRVRLEATSDAQLADLCFTLTSGRHHFPERFAAVAGSIAQLRSALAERLEASAPARPRLSGKRQLAFLFSGQGSQYAGMAAELYRDQPVFRTAVDRCAKQLRGRLDRPLLEVLFGAGDAAALIDETAYTQPALFVIQAALVELWRSWQIVPDVVLGHSVGEFAAAYCAGSVTLEEALELVTERARLMQRLPRDGAMASVSADEATVAKTVQREDSDTLAIAAVNGPQTTVISGRRDVVSRVMTHFESVGIRCHEFRHLAVASSARIPEVVWISTLSGTTVAQPPDAQYWCDQALRPVRFADAMKRVGELGITDFVEIGPGKTLLALGKQCLASEQQSWLASLSRRCGNLSELLSSLGDLYQGGYEVDWDGFNRPFQRRRVSLPTYPFERQRFWIENEVTRRSTRSHPMGLTGIRLRSALPDGQFESSYSLQRFTYLDDHRVYGMPVLPTTAGLAALREAARQYFASDAVEIANLQYREAMILPERGELIVHAVLTPLDDLTAEFRLLSTAANGAETWRTHMAGLARKRSPASNGQMAPLRFDQVRERCAGSIPVDRYYEALRSIGLEYGASFRGIEMLRRGSGEAFTQVRLPGHVSTNAQPGLHPALLDACLHVYPVLLDAHRDFMQPAPARLTYLPVSIERFHYAEIEARAWRARCASTSGKRRRHIHGRHRHVPGRRPVCRCNRRIELKIVAARSIDTARRGPAHRFAQARGSSSGPKRN